MSNTDKVNVSYTLDQDVINYINQKAKDTRRSKSWIANELIKLAIQSNPKL